MNHNEIYSEVIERGYYFGSNYDILTAEECIKLQKALEQDISNGSLLKTYYDPITQKHLYFWQYFMQADYPEEIFGPLNIAHFIKYLEDNLSERKKYVKENNIHVMQQWFYTAFNNYSHVIKNSTLQIKIKEFIAKVYSVPLNKIIIEPVKISFYDKDDFLSPHIDGKNKGRLCSLIIYLADPASYDNSKGGNFLLHSKNIKYDHLLNFDDMEKTLNPTHPNYVLLDFTKNNLYHAVKKCNVRFDRFAILCFPTLID